MFAQLMSEMLSVSTFESFRVYSLGTISRISEAIEIINDIKRDVLPRAALEPILCELQWSLQKDAVAQELAGLEIESLEEIIKTKQSSVDLLYSNLVLIYRKIHGKYKVRLEDKIVSCAIDRRMIDLRRLAGFYCSHLVNMGYSKPYIAESIEKVFFRDNIKRIGKATLGRFFKYFDGREKPFIVHAGVTADLGRYLEQLGFSIKPVAGVPADSSGTIATNTTTIPLVSIFEWSGQRLDAYCYAGST